LIENEYEEEHGTEGNECGNGNLKECVGYIEPHNRGGHTETFLSQRPSLAKREGAMVCTKLKARGLEVGK
jgi:hypothetical protein